MPGIDLVPVVRVSLPLPLRRPRCVGSGALAGRFDHGTLFTLPASNPAHDGSYLVGVGRDRFVAHATADLGVQLVLGVAIGPAGHDALALLNNDFGSARPRQRRLRRVSIAVLAAPQFEEVLDGLRATKSGKLHLCSPDGHVLSIVVAWVACSDAAASASRLLKSVEKLAKSVEAATSCASP
eukprot:scaffold7071_cov260-Pinguiococcus_pyrenoidosus.AAC.7